MTLTTIPPWFSVAKSAHTFLAAAAQTWEDTQASERSIQQALAQPNIDLAVMVSAYRYYFYKNNNARALEMATSVCDRIHQSEQWPLAWTDLKPILLARLEDEKARLYLSAYIASGLLLARLGDVDTAQTIADQIQQLQAKEFGAELLHNILNPSPEEED